MVTWKLRLAGVFSALALAAVPALADGPGVVKIDQSGYSATEGSTVQVVVERSQGEDGAASVRVLSSDGSALAGSDYAAVDITLNWAAGDGSDRLFVVEQEGRIRVFAGMELNTEDGHVTCFGLHEYVFGMHRADELAGHVALVGAQDLKLPQRSDEALDRLIAAAITARGLEFLEQDPRRIPYLRRPLPEKRGVRLQQSPLHRRALIGLPGLLADTAADRPAVQVELLR